jgi:hypothetical protein
MAGNNHKKPQKIGKFCATRGCKENDYRAKCQCSWKRGCQAHHIVCVSSVGAGLISTPGIEPILRNTEWCINDAHNMIAMPVWGATVKHYCAIRKVGSFFKLIQGPPPFVNIPQHNWDHNIKEGYTDEVTSRLARIGVKIVARDHKGEAQDVAGQLNDIATYFRSELNYRGSQRKGGTHTAWEGAVTSDGGVGTEWYLPFSMAQDGMARERGFPLKKDSADVGAWIGRIANLLKG